MADFGITLTQEHSGWNANIIKQIMEKNSDKLCGTLESK